jgi:hypothetical protein
MWGSGGITPPFLTPAVDADMCPIHARHFTSKEKDPSIHWAGGWMGTTAALDAIEKINILLLLGIKPWPFSPQPIAIPTELSCLSIIHLSGKLKSLLGWM